MTFITEFLTCGTWHAVRGLLYTSRCAVVRHPHQDKCHHLGTAEQWEAFSFKLFVKFKRQSQDYEFVALC